MTFLLPAEAFDRARTEAIDYFLFDLPYFEGWDLRATPLEQRRQLLQRLLAALSLQTLRYSKLGLATVARRLGHIEKINESDRPENAIAGVIAHDVAAVSARQGAEVTLTSIFAIDKMQASRHEVEHALAEGIASGRLDSSIDATGNDEVTQLLKSMQRMQAQLQSVMAAQGELARQHDAGSQHKNRIESFILHGSSPVVS